MKERRILSNSAESVSWILTFLSFRPSYLAFKQCLDSRYVSYIDQNCGIAAAGSTSSVFSAPSKGLSSAAVAGIAAGVIGVALGLCVLLIFLLAGRRKKRAQVQAAQAAAQAAPASGAVLPPKAMDEVLPKYAEKDDMFPPTYEVNETKEAA